MAKSKTGASGKPAEPPKLKATPEFFKALNSLNEEQQEAAYRVFKKFRADPFDPSLHPHKINKLTARFGRTVWSVTVAGNLRAAFMVVDGAVVSVGIGTHDIYK